jgi:hypothetical protein
MKCVRDGVGNVEQAGVKGINEGEFTIGCWKLVTCHKTYLIMHKS